jgi:exonuclease SbcD
MARNRLRVFHTADWHLGQRFNLQDRHAEHERFLAFLLEQIEARRPDLLVVAGDVFDTSNPVQTAQQQYYQFLARLVGSPLRQTLIVAGNHDSPRFLDAPRELLAALSIRVVGFAPAEPSQCVYQLTDRATGRPLARVGAVPFLRDADVRRSFEAESHHEASQRLVAGIANYYQRVGEALVQGPADVPALVTGHLFAQGLDFEESDEVIHVGNQGRVPASAFPNAAYVALGHIHRPQAVAGLEHIRYSGSPIPLSFSEADQQKYVIELEFDGPELAAVHPIAIPPSRRLLRLKADTPGQLAQALAAAGPRPSDLDDWLEVSLSRPPESTYWREQLDETATRAGAVLLSCPLEGTAHHISWNTADEDSDTGLDQLQPEYVFEQLYRSRYPDSDLPEELRMAFLEVMDAVLRGENLSA